MPDRESPLPLLGLLLPALLASSGWTAAQDPVQLDPPESVPNVPADLTRLEVLPAALDFGAVPMGARRSQDLVLRNGGYSSLELTGLAFLLGTSGDSAAFEVALAGRRYEGSTSDVQRVIYPPLVLERGAELVATVTFEAQADQLDAFLLRWTASGESVDVPVLALGGHAGDHFLHVVIEGRTLHVDYDGDGSELAVLDGSGSHTHEPGQSIVAHDWYAGEELLASSPTLRTTLTAPSTEIRLTISDDGLPPQTLDGFVGLRLVTPDQVPGVLARYYPAAPGGAVALLDAALAAPGFVEQRPTPSLDGSLQVGGSPFTRDVLVQMVGRLAIDRPASYAFTVTGGAGHRLLVDGKPVPSSVLLLPGSHELELRWAVETLEDLPLDVGLLLDGLAEPIGEEALTHDETGLAPVLHALTASGAPEGGTPVTIEGFAFFPPGDVVVSWGGLELRAADLTMVEPTRLQLLAPPGSGTIEVTVANANGASAPRPFAYGLGGPPPIAFRRDQVVEVHAPTAGVWASDGKLYVISLDGALTALEFDPDYELVARASFPGVAALPNHEALGLTVNPYDPPDPVRLYVAHGDLYLHDGESPTGPSPYTGQISVLTGPDFDQPEPLITGLPVSNNSHAINGLAFDDNGDLLISVGSMTNAGVRHPGLGDLPESPLSAAVLKAFLSRPDFDGAVSYVETLTGLPNDDQRSGEEVDVAPGVDLEVHASGLRNAFGLVYTTRGRLYLTDNGPNVGYGPASTGPDTEAPDPADDDELDLIERENYYGLPNRARGRTDPRQNVYYGGAGGPASLPNTLFQMIAQLPSSCDGIDEYRADTFAGQLRGDLVVQKFLGRMQRVRLRPDGRALLALEPLEPLTRGLGCVTGPGGAILSFDYQNSEVEVLEPDEALPSELVVHDIFPWRATHEGGTPFVLAGRGFGALESTAVRIGGRPAELTEVTSTRIRGRVPRAQDATPALLDVVVASGASEDTLPEAFRYLLGRGQEPGRWERLADVDAELSAVAAGVIDGTMVLVGQGARATFAYDLQAREWLANRAQRPYPGLYHSAEVLGGKLYLVGGLGGSSERRVQVYDPATDAWTVAADVPWRGGGVATAVIDGLLYAAGGLSYKRVEDRCARYDPAENAWTPLSSLPFGLSHAAAGTDGHRLFLFGGRSSFETVANGLDLVLVYDPLADAWSWSGDGSSPLVPLPEARSGMGKAVFLRGEFHVFGGETLDDPDAGPLGVFGRVDVYDPVANAWRKEAPMPTPRHGIAPVLFQGHVFLAGGAKSSGLGRSSVFETFTRQ